MDQDNLTPSTSGRGFSSSLVFIILAAVMFALFIKAFVGPPVSPQLGQEFPPIEVAGWLNSPGLTNDDVRGRVMVVEAWAYWCGPCRGITPLIIDLHKKYQEQGVVFLGLTIEGLDPQSLKKSRDYVESEHPSYPNGYGAVKIMDALNVQSIPQLWVVNHENKIVHHSIGWGPNSIRDLEQAVIAAQKALPAKAEPQTNQATSEQATAEPPAVEKPAAPENPAP